MNDKTSKNPKSKSLTLKRVSKKLKKMPMADRIQLLVKAELMSQADADRAKKKLVKQ